MSERRLDRGGQPRLPFDEPPGGPPPAVSRSPRQTVPQGDSISAGPREPAPLPPDPPPASPPPRLVLRYVRNPRARRYILRVRPDGIVRVTVPRGGTLGGAADFVRRHRAWIDGQLAKLQRREPASLRPLAAGDLVPLRGVPTPLRVEAAHKGRVKVHLGDAPACLTAPTNDLRPAVAAMLRALAQRELPGRLLALASRHGLAVTRVTVRNQQSRWGSCSASGAISLNWRLVQMPPEVCDYVLIHELMHLREANHSRRFWRHVAKACPWHLEARRWLNREGKALL